MHVFRINLNIMIFYLIMIWQYPVKYKDFWNKIHELSILMVKN